MKYKTDSELREIINKKSLLNGEKEKAEEELKDREGKSFDELNYRLNLIQTKKISEINGMMIFFVVLTILSIAVSTFLILEGS